MTKRIISSILSCVLLLSMVMQVQSVLWADTTGVDTNQFVYLPLIATGPEIFACATISTEVYTAGDVTAYDTDDPVRPAAQHADKNIALRSYAANTDGALQRELVDYGSDDPTQPPQFATLFSPNQVPPFAEFYRVYNWAWAASPEAGTRGEISTFYKTTALGLTLPEGEPLYVPTSGYDIGGGMEVVVLYADADTVTLHYSREDTAARGYTLHIDNICTDPNLLDLYEQLDAPDGDRYTDPSAGYQLPELAAGQKFGTTDTDPMVILIADTGSFQDPRSCNEWWQIRPDYTGSCPAAITVR